MRPDADDLRRATTRSDLPGFGMSIYHLERTGNAGELSKMLSGSDSAAVRARAAEALGELEEHEGPVVEKLIHAAVDDPDGSVRASAVDALDGLGGNALERLLARMDGFEPTATDATPVDAFVKALAHEMPELRMAAANAIARAEAVEATPALLARLDDDDPRVRLRVVRATGRVGDVRAVEPLSSLTTDPSPRMRREVATALGEIGEEPALAGLFSLVDDDDRTVRLAAVTALGEFSSSAPIERLVECLDDEDEEIRRAAVYAIVELLSNAPPEQSHEMRLDVVDALSTSHGEVVTASLAELFEESTEPHQRRNATWLLGRVTDSEGLAIDTLVTALDDDDEMVRQFAATSLAEIGTPAVEEALLAALDTTFGEGRSMILFTLGKVGTEESRQRLVRLLDEVDSIEIQEQALSALSRLGGTGS